MDLLNVGYEVLLQVLSRYFAHSDESPERLGVLAAIGRADVHGESAAGHGRHDTAGRPDLPGVTAGPGFELFYEVDYLLPHQEAA